MTFTPVLVKPPALVPTRGELLKIARNRAGISVTRMAAELECSVATVGNYESGRTHAKAPVVATYARLTGYPEDELRGPDDGGASGLPITASRCIELLAAA